MLNDYTGGPTQLYWDAIKYVFLVASVGYIWLSYYWSDKRRTRKRLNKHAPNNRLHIDGVTTYA